MASRAANKRLTREYQIIQKNPPPFIIAHPSETNILEWHYVLTGPPETPYEGGQYWGTLIFPPTYPFAPPAIRMHTPSGRFQPSTRLCLSISDFHPKSFNPAWEVSTILIGLMSFMTSDEMTTGSVSATPHERKLFAAQSKWWNSTGGGSTPKTIPGVSGSNASGHGNVKAGDGGAKFKSEWAELDEENWKFMKEKRIDPKTGRYVPDPTKQQSTLGTDMLQNRSKHHGGNSLGALEGGQRVPTADRGWLASHKMLVGVVAVIAYVVLARIMGNGNDG